MSCRSVALGPLAWATLLSSCGYVGIELRELPREDGGADPSDAAVLTEAGASGDASQALDASTPGEDAAAGDGALDTRDASLDATALDAGSEDVGGTCSLDSSWAVQVRVPLSWAGSTIEPGLADALIWLRYRRSQFQGTQSSATWTGTAEPCGIALPDFRLSPLVASETYALRVASSLFDNGYITPVTSTISMVGNGVGAPVSIPPAAFVIGTSLANPLVAAWPDNTVLTSVDTDMNGQPGFTVSYLNDATHVYPPADLLRNQRASAAFVAVRIAFDASGSLTSCNTIDGPVAFSRFDTHILGCTLAGGGNCNATTTDFLDDNRPLYAPNAASYHAIQVPANTTCAQVRTMLPP